MEISWYKQLWYLRDRRVDNWFMMSSPWPTVLLTFVYWFCSIVLGPYLMKNRSALELKKPIQIYNLIQVVSSAYMFYEACVIGWFSHYNWLCQPVEMDAQPNSYAMRMAAVCHLYYLSKFTEFADTFFFIARKKFSHVSKLQLIHHGIMPIHSYMVVRWLPGGHESFGGTFNALVHVIMYSYYFLGMWPMSSSPYMSQLAIWTPRVF